MWYKRAADQDNATALNVGGVLYAAGQGACLTSRPPVFISRCCRLVSDQLLIRRGSPSRRHRLPRLYILALCESGRPGWSFSTMVSSRLRR